MYSFNLHDLGMLSKSDSPACRYAASQAVDINNTVLPVTFTLDPRRQPLIQDSNYYPAMDDST